VPSSLVGFHFIYGIHHSRPRTTLTNREARLPELLDVLPDRDRELEIELASSLKATTTLAPFASSLPNAFRSAPAEALQSTLTHRDEDAR
jgi:hypothetical protein